MSKIWTTRKFQFDLSERNLVMGVLNVTPDSFSDGGKFFDADRAVVHGVAMAAQGADIIDVGGESTRPGSPPVGDEEQSRRVLRVIEALAEELSIPISVDTTRSAVARLALAAGASIINDISGLRDDPQIARLAAESGAGLVLMHMRGTPESMQTDTHYDDLLGEIARSLQEAIDKSIEAGVRPEQVVVDPGIGFAKTAEQNVEILRNLAFLESLGRPILVGVSRKSFLGKITNRPASERLGESVAAVLYAASRGANIHRVHDVAEIAAALAVNQVLNRQ